MKKIKAVYLNPNNVDMTKPGFFHLKYQESIITEDTMTFIYKVIKNRLKLWKPKKLK